MLRRLLPLCCLLFASCTADPPPPAPPTTALTAADAPAASSVVEDTVVADQIAYTAAQNPEILSNAPTEVPITPTVKPVAPPPPTNTSPASPPRTTAAPAPVASSTAPDHAAWNQLLQHHVSADGRVDYLGMQGDETALDSYLATLAEETPQEDWSRAEALAYWINAYNAYTVKLILNNWPVTSIRDIDKPWEQKWIQLGGKTYSLNNIEHDIIRPRFKEPRIHFALVCAAKSCPPLPNEAFTAQNLDRLLERRTRQFINDEKFNVTQEAVVRVSPLFDWYGEDFGDVRDFLNDYLATDIPAGKEITFLDYDWSLNN